MIAQFWADIELARMILSWACFLFGGLAVVSGALGIVRFPDFYTRLHAAGVTDTGGAEMILLGMLLQSPTWIVAVKLFFIGAFMFFTSPVATHAIAHSAWMVGLKPLEGPELKYRESAE
ncbi:monovalent cation/H(+) antiporter subunit G [Hyphococcus sp.]|uniref:monovalent cation/H(+) antiporter subunit G n=1 Tax=Hyphococcus sp. TaxID=2038636 RepID=UPI0035C74B90